MFKNISLLIKITWPLNRDHSFADLKIFEVLRLSSPLWETATRKKREREESNYWSRGLVSSWKSQRFLDSPKESNAPVRYIRDRCTHVTFIDFYARSRGKDVRPLIETSLSLTQRLVRRTRTRRKKKKEKICGRDVTWRVRDASSRSRFCLLYVRMCICFVYSVFNPFASDVLDHRGTLFFHLQIRERSFRNARYCCFGFYGRVLSYDSESL